MARKLAFDPVLFITAILLTLVGLVMVPSASTAMSIGRGIWIGAPLAKQLLLALLGGAAMYGAMSMRSYTDLNKPHYAWGGLLVVFVLLVWALFLPTVDGVNRFLRFGPATFQPSEAAKLAVIFFFASHFSEKNNHPARNRQALAVGLAVLGVTAVLVGLGQDLGTAAVLGVVGLSVLYFAGARWTGLGVAVAGGAAGALLLFLSRPFRLDRWTSFLNPEADPLGASFQLNQSLMAVSTGGVTGLGLGQGQQKLHFLPQPTNDFIFGVVGEETGLVGCLVVLGLFLVLLWRGLYIARRAPDRFGRLLAAGITMMIVFQGLTNISVTLGLVPTTGMPLPLISSGGSSLVVCLAGLGLLLNISQYTKRGAAWR
jgi:cell division protein FtsW